MRSLLMWSKYTITYYQRDYMSMRHIRGKVTFTATRKEIKRFKGDISHVGLYKFPDVKEALHKNSLLAKAGCTKTEYSFSMVELKWWERLRFWK